MSITKCVTGSAVVVLMTACGQVGHTSASARAVLDEPTRPAPYGLLVFQETDQSTGVPTVATVRVGQTRLHYLTPGVQSEHADWSPTGRYVVYDDGGELEPPGGHVHLFRVDVHGGRSVQLTFGAGDQGLPSVDPTGRYAAFDGNWPDGSAAGFHSGVGIVDLRTGALREITHNPSDGCGGPCTDSNPAWSPDGRLIAFVRDQGDDAAIVTIRPDGSRPRTLTSPGTVAGNPDWSPTGDRIVFNDNDSNRTSAAANIWVVGRRGVGPAERLTDNDPATGSSFQPTWSSDGRWIAFVHHQAGDASTRLFVMTATGADQHDLGVAASLPFSPAWGPSVP
jgi:Tol biopolymer transport system component